MSVLRRSRAPADQEAGFTLIELLVVIIIIGILSAIAIPVFLNQRTKAYDAAAKSDLHHLAKFEEVYLSDIGSYGTIAGITGASAGLRVSAEVTLSVVRYNSSLTYCLSAQHAGSPRSWYYDSAAGGLQPLGSAGCPLTTTGTAGDSVTG